MEPWERAASGSGFARTRGQQLESGGLQVYAAAGARESDAPRGGVQSVQPNAVRSAEHGGDDGRQQHAGEGHQSDKSAQADADCVPVDVLGNGAVMRVLRKLLPGAGVLIAAALLSAQAASPPADWPMHGRDA